MNTPLILTLAATGASGMLAGASLDQSIKQLPARRRIGAVAYAAYVRGADLANGVIWYATLGIGAALLSLIAGLLTFRHSLAGVACIVLPIAHSLVTSRAAPTLMRLRVAGDEPQLSAILGRFERWQSLRAALQFANLLALLSLSFELLAT